MTISETINESNKAHLINLMTLQIVLLRKGIVTAEELDAVRNLAISTVDQAWQERLDDLNNADK